MIVYVRRGGPALLWSSTHRPRVQGIAPLEVGRCEAAEPVPDRCEVVDRSFRPPAPTPEEIEAAERWRDLQIEELSASASPIDQAEADALRHESPERIARRAIGDVSPLAWCAGPAVPSLEIARERHLRALSRWTSRCSCAVVRADLKGYRVWAGLGSLLDHVGAWPTVDEAAEAAVDAVLARRLDALDDARERELKGWAEETPYHSSTLRRALHELPIAVHRGPVTSGESGSSWDLPVWRVWREGDWAEVHDDVVTWDDAESRRQAWAARRNGERRRKAEQDRALTVFADRCPQLEQRSGRIVPVRIRTRAGVEAFLIGDVKMRRDQADALVRAQINGQLLWLAADLLVGCSVEARR